MRLPIMYDAADPANIPAGIDTVAAGYLHPGDPLQPWTRPQWRSFDGRRKLPILVRSDPTNRSEAEADVFAALRELFDLGADHCLTALDIETANDPVYVTRFGQVMNHYGYRVLCYGSRVNLLSLPSLDGRWLADPGGHLHDYPRSDDIRAMQNASDPAGFDRSDLRPFLSEFGDWWI